MEAVTIAGIIVIHRSARPRVHHRGELGVSVRQKFWGMGIGRALCEAAIVEARHIGFAASSSTPSTTTLAPSPSTKTWAFSWKDACGVLFGGAVEHDDLVMGLRRHAEP